MAIERLREKTISPRPCAMRPTRLAIRKIMTGLPEQLTPFFKRIAFKKGRLAAIIATARKLAVIIWNMIVKAEPYRKSQVELSDEKQKSMKLKQLDKKLHALQLTKDELEKLFLKHSLSMT